MELNNQHGQGYNLDHYAEGIKSVQRRPKPHMQKHSFTDVDGIVKDRMIFSIKYGSAPNANHTSNLFDIFDVCDRRGHEVRKGFLNTFSNGVTTYTINLDHQINDHEYKEI